MGTRSIARARRGGVRSRDHRERARASISTRASSEGVALPATSSGPTTTRAIGSPRSSELGIVLASASASGGHRAARGRGAMTAGAGKGLAKPVGARARAGGSPRRSRDRRGMQRRRERRGMGARADGHATGGAGSTGSASAGGAASDPAGAMGATGTGAAGIRQRGRVPGRPCPPRCPRIPPAPVGALARRRRRSRRNAVGPRDDVPALRECEGRRAREELPGRWLRGAPASPRRDPRERSVRIGETAPERTARSRSPPAPAPVPSSPIRAGARGLLPSRRDLSRASRSRSS
jgi:hypothetical protein